MNPGPMFLVTAPAITSPSEATGSTPKRPHRRPPRPLALVIPVLLLASACGAVPARPTAGRASAPSASPSGIAKPQTNASSNPTPSPASRPTATATAQPSPATAEKTARVAVSLPIQIELEPNDYLHRNYCVEGAIAVLLSTWTRSVPSIDAIGQTAHVVESYGTTGANAVVAINYYLEQITGSTRFSYSGAHVTNLDVFESDLQTDLSGLGRLAAAGHGSPVLVHVMTATLPGWDGYQAQHMVAVYGYNFTAGNPMGDTVTYAESAGSVAGYNGPHVETISLQALWTAMQNYNQDITTDPVTVIS